MHFCHAGEIWHDFPQLVPGVLAAERITADGVVEQRMARFVGMAESRLVAQPESQFAEIEAWRRAFSRMGLKPTQYRCASEALLRRFRKERSLPQIHPLIDLCNVISMAFAIPVAVFDLAEIADSLEVRYATGAEVFESFSGETENPERGEVVFVDGAGRAHARRWTNRQSGYSAVSGKTTAVLIVAEALHESACADVPALVDAIAGEVSSVWSSRPSAAVLSVSSPRFEF